MGVSKWAPLEYLLLLSERFFLTVTKVALNLANFPKKIFNLIYFPIETDNAGIDVLT